MGGALSCPGCAPLRSPLVQLPRILQEKNARQPSCMCVREVETPESLPNGVDSVQSVEGGAEKEKKNQKEHSSQTPRLPIQPASSGSSSRPLWMCACVFSVWLRRQTTRTKEKSRKQTG